MRNRLAAFLEGVVRRTEMRRFLLRGYAVALAVSLLTVGIGVGWMVYFYLCYSSAGELAIHIEACWYQAYPETRPTQKMWPPGPPVHHAPPPPGAEPGAPLPPGAEPGAPPPDAPGGPERPHGGPHRPTFRLQAPPQLTQDAPTLVKAIASHPFLIARIVSPQGQVLAASRGGESLPAVESESWRLTSDRPWFPRPRFVNVDGHTVLVIEMPVVHDGQLVGIVQAGKAWFMQAELLRWLALWGVIGLVLAVAVAYFVSALLANAIVAPLGRLASAARRLAAGDLSTRVGLPSGSNELMTVAGTFDEMAEQVQASFDAQKRFVADASHELKTPLTAIGGMVDLLEVGADFDAAQRETIISTMSREVERMGVLVNDLLMLSRAEQGERRGEPLDICDLVRGVVDEARSLHAERAIDAEVAGPLWTCADAEGLRRAVSNLVDNALKYSGPASRVRVRAARGADDHVEIVVDDEGVGIGADDLAHVFERFYRADRSRARATGGTGLGLSIVKAIVESAGGTVSLQSEPGEGTTATMRLPACEPA